MPTQRRRHTITETPRVEEALNRLRAVTGGSIDVGELVVLGADAKLAEFRARGADPAVLRRQLAERIRSRAPLADIAAADEVRRAGWARE